MYLNSPAPEKQENSDIIPTLHELYTITTTPQGRQTVIRVASMDTSLETLLQLVEKKGKFYFNYIYFATIDKLPVAQQLILLSLLGTDVGVRGQRKIMNGLLYYEGRGKLLGIIESRVTCGHA